MSTVQHKIQVEVEGYRLCAVYDTSPLHEDTPRLYPYESVLINADGILIDRLFIHRPSRRRGARGWAGHWEGSTQRIQNGQEQKFATMQELRAVAVEQRVKREKLTDRMPR